MTELELTPLLRADSPLDERQRGVIRDVAEAEYAKILTLPTDDPLDAKRRYRVEVTRDELVAQPEAIRQTWARNASVLGGVAESIAESGITKAFLVGAGDSFAVWVAARGLLERALGVTCEPVQSLEFAYYGADLIDEHTLVIALSSSGRTTRTVEAALIAQRRSAVTLALTNTPGSPLDEECENTLLIEATRVGWPTQATTAALALVARLAVGIASARGTAERELEAELDRVPELISSVVAQTEASVAEIAEAEAGKWMYLFAAGGPNLACAIVGAAKVRECSPNHAQSIQIEEYHHYNSQKPGEPIWIIAPDGPSVARALDTARDARRYGGSVYVVTSEGVDVFDDIADRVLKLPVLAEALSPLVYMVPVQLFGYHVAMAKFRQAEVDARG